MLGQENIIKLTKNNPNKAFKSVERPKEVEKFKIHREIFSSWKIKKEFLGGGRTHDLPHHGLRPYPLRHKSLDKATHGILVILS